MCRWFAYISPTEPCLLEDVLITPKHSLVKQVHEHYLPGLIPHHPENMGDDQLLKARNSVFNIDGLGVSWYTSVQSDYELIGANNDPNGTTPLGKQGLRPAFYKTIAPPIHDLNFRSICANTESRCLLAHIRAASGTPIVHTNNHPFIFGRHAFMHNGVVSSFSTIRRAICGLMCDAAHDGILGSTDSEHLGALYMTQLTSRGDVASWEREYTVEEMAEAMEHAIATVIKSQMRILGDDKMTPNSLNLCATDGVKMVACRFRNHETQQPPSLYYSVKAGTTLNRKYEDHPDGEAVKNASMRKDKSKHGEHLIVASEPSTYIAEDWVLIGKNQILLADHEGKVRVREMAYDKQWNAVDPTVQ